MEPGPVHGPARADISEHLDGAGLRHLPGTIAAVVPWLTMSLQIGFRRYLGPRDSYDARWRQRDVGAIVSTNGPGMAKSTKTMADTEIELRRVVKH
jgi:hypothetical protein